MPTPISYPPYQHPILDRQTGLVTKPWQLFFLSLVAGDQVVEVIPPGSITIDKWQAIHSPRLLGRGSSGTGPVEQLTIGFGLALAATVLGVTPEAFHLRGTRAAQPAATAVPTGTLYCVTDERQEIERSTGTVWELWTPRRHAAIFPYDFSDQIVAPPTSSQVRINAAAPYSAATKIWVRLIANDGRDVYYGLMGTDVGTTVRIQDKNDHTIAATFTVTGPPVDQTTYVEWPVVWVATSGAALFNNQAVLVIKQ